MTQRAYFIHLGDVGTYTSNREFMDFWNRVQKTEIPGLNQSYLVWTDLDLNRLQSFGISGLLALPIDYGQLQSVSGGLPGYLADFTRYRVQAA
jgi:hypothetical protein